MIFIQKKEVNEIPYHTDILEKVGGIDLDGIVKATNIINPIVDKYDIVDNEYILDVISKERG